MSYYTQLTLVQRYMIYRLLKFGCSQGELRVVRHEFFLSGRVKDDATATRPPPD